MIHVNARGLVSVARQFYLFCFIFSIGFYRRIAITLYPFVNLNENGLLKTEINRVREKTPTGYGNKRPFCINLTSTADLLLYFCKH